MNADSRSGDDAMGAGGRVVDALLAQHLSENGASMESRYARAFAALDREALGLKKTSHETSREASSAQRGSSGTREAGATLATLARRGRFAALQYARAALLAFALGTVLFLLPVETRAAVALAGAATNEARAATDIRDRRYEVEVVLENPREDAREGRGDPDRPRTLRGFWDLRGNESRLELRAEGFPSFIRADARDGAWEMREGGRVRRLDTRALWPRWIEGENGEIAVERMDDLLRLVQRHYTVAIARGGAESPAQLRGALHIVAERRGPVRGPSEIDLWIDTTRQVVLEAWMRWDSHNPPMPPSPEGRAPRGDGRSEGRGEERGEGRGAAPDRGASPDRGARADRSMRGNPGLQGDRGMQGTRGMQGARGMQGEPGAPRDQPAPPPPPPHRAGPRPDDDYRAAPGALPPAPPAELRLRRIEPIEFPAEHFAPPKG